MPVKYENNVVKLKAELNQTTLAWLHEVAVSIADMAKSLCKFKSSSEDRLGGDLALSYDYKLDTAKGTAIIGSPLESAYWEEFGTGEYADTKANGGKRGRQGWWVYIDGGEGDFRPTNVYHSEEEAVKMAKQISAEHHVRAIATNGTKPNYTITKAFEKVMPKAIKRLQQLLDGG